MAGQGSPTFGIEVVNLGNNQVKLDIKDVWYVVERILKVTHAQIDGVQPRTAKRWDVTLFPRYENICNGIKADYMDQNIPLYLGKVVRILDPLEIVTEVTVRKAPMWWTEHRIREIFSRYGTVKSIKKERYRDMDAEGTSFGGLWNGNRRIHMVIRNDIPSGITISETTLEIFHRGQHPTCRTCGMTGHKFYQCRTPKQQRENIFDEDEFPNLPNRQHQQQQQQSPQAQQHQQQHQHQPDAEVAAEINRGNDEQHSSGNLDYDSDNESFSSASALENLLQVESLIDSTDMQHQIGYVPSTHVQDDYGQNQDLLAQGDNQEFDLDLVQRNAQENHESITQWVNQEDQTSTAQRVNPVIHTETVQESFNGGTQVRSIVSTPISPPSQITPLYSAETPIENLTTSSSSELSHEAESTDGSLIGATGLHKVVMIQGDNSQQGTQQQQRRLSERRPRGSSTTSNDDTLNVDSTSRKNSTEDLHESEPFSQVFINRTKERMLKKKYKAHENVASSGYWV